MRTSLDLPDIQGLILSGYGDRPAARYGLFEIVDVARARRWLASLVPELQFGEYRRSARHEQPLLKPLCANVAFTAAGFRTLGLTETALAGFSLAFQEGMNEPERARRLGDDGESAPERWEWGYPGQALHGVLAVFAGRDDAEEAEWEVIRAFLERQLCAEHGVKALRVLDTLATNRASRREHFGFRDGITNPRIAGLSRGRENLIEPGEVLLGYKNGYGHYPLSPEVQSSEDPDGRLPVSLELETRRDFGRNGSYLVFRQLRQNVSAFWAWMQETSARIPDAPRGVQGAVWLASKVIGRWPNGTPLTIYPEAPGPDAAAENDEFAFGEHGDAYGSRCPIGSHIRRTNPRDTALPVPHDPELSGTPEDSGTKRRRMKLSDLHRILRRGRLYGDPCHDRFDPSELCSGKDDGKDRGIHFLCFNANLSRQFEFIQSNWVNNPCFAGLSSDPDPLLGARRAYPFGASDFTIQGYPPRRVRNLPRLVEVKGGAYFFMPGRSALLYLSRA